ncbi:MAG: hypothetical protein ACK40L_12740 [Hydrogenophaga sp.]
MLKTAISTVLLLLSTQVMAVNKCTGPDGKVVFQDARCEGKGETLNIRPSSGAAPTGSSVSAPEIRAKRQAEIDGIHRRSDIRAAIERGEPMVGMTRAQLEQALGAPNLVNANNYGGVLKDQIIYDRPGQSWYVYTENGVVTSIQHRPSESRAAAVRCPSPQEIRSMETSASSITLGERERVERLRQIGEAKRCGR